MDGEQGQKKRMKLYEKRGKRLSSAFATQKKQDDEGKALKSRKKMVKSARDIMREEPLVGGDEYALDTNKETGEHCESAAEIPTNTQLESDSGTQEDTAAFEFKQRHPPVESEKENDEDGESDRESEEDSGNEEDGESDKEIKEDSENEEEGEDTKDGTDGEDEEVDEDENKSESEEEGKDEEAEDEEESVGESDKSDNEEEDEDEESDIMMSHRAKKSKSNDIGPSTRTRSKVNKDEKAYGLVDESDESDEYVPESVSDDEGTKPGSSKKTTHDEVNKAPPKTTWLSIDTRMSPKKLYETINILTKSQRAEVRKLRLGHLLKLRMDEIPKKLAHFVVDRFDPKDMVIDLGETKLHINADAVVKVLGLPNSGVLLESSKKKSTSTLVAGWKARYGTTYISPNQVSKMIKAERKHTQNEYFKLDFISLMVGTLFYAMRSGSMMLDYMKSIDDNTDLGNINWCKFMLSSLKECKKGWKRDGMNSWFVGPLTCLVLVYVDGTTCGAFPQDRVVPPMTFWTKEKLDARQRYELENDGFGKGKKRDLYVDEKGDESEIEEDPTTLKSCIDELEDAFDQMERGKGRVVKVLKAAVAKFKNEKKVDEFLQRYKSFFTCVDDITETIRETTFVNEPDAEPQNVHHSLDEVVANIVRTVSEIKEHPTSSKVSKKRKRVKDPSIPSFELLSSSQSTPESDAGENKKKEVLKAVQMDASKKAPPRKNTKNVEAKKVLKKGTVTKFTRPASPVFPKYVKLAEENRMKKPVADYTRKEVDINEPIDNIEKTLWIYLRKMFRDKKVDDMKKPAKVVKGVGVVEASKDGTSKSNALVVKDDRKSVGPTTSYMQPIFESSHGFRTQAFMMTTMLTGRWVVDDVITCWAILMNHEEMVVTNNMPKRLYLHARTITDEMIKVAGSCNVAALCEKFKKNIKYVLEDREDLMDMKCFDLVVVPVFENRHYYVVMFDMRNPSVEVVDNMDEEFICRDVGCAYIDMGTPAKIKYLLFNYIEGVKHPIAKFLLRTHISRKKVEWSTVDNDTDCGVFAMRHMEMYKGRYEPFECGFSLAKDVQDAQLTNLRMRYATKIMSSPSNVIATDIIKAAGDAIAKMRLTTEDGKEPDEVEEDNALLSYVEEECEEVERKLRDVTGKKTRNVDGTEAKSKGKRVSRAE
ncbi:hypothetical protein SSX86_031719 [Deinandra increscens subsp. villosa]|uniref:Ubiquitin-like protease family profile domain-containing protein n=1 Tax=Deinandra increscens subsp. villosa TaxID=3103831 RepID=A0AAP0C913_9ASTR